MSFKHRHKASDAEELLKSFAPAKNHLNSDMERVESASLLAPNSPSSATTAIRKAAAATPESKSERGPNLQAFSSPVGTAGPSAAESVPEATFSIRGTMVKARLNRIGMELTAVRAPMVSCIGRDVLGLLPYSDIIGASTEERSTLCASTCCTHQSEVLVIHTFKRANRNRSLWRPRRIHLASLDDGLVREWASKINLSLKALTDRPSKVMVVINPYGGARKALQIWEKMAFPVFHRAGLEVDVRMTEHEGHARKMVEELTAAAFEGFDGVVAVGGDGLFGEIMNGVLAVRAKGGKEGQVAARWRLGHIPAGSTDAVAYSINGTRSAVTAAMHIALGDRTALDLMRVDTADGEHRFVVSLAGYGYMGDLMQASEKLRWMGPPRYTTAGAVTLFRGQTYHARIAYRPVDSSRFSLDVSRVVCRSHCNLCTANAQHIHPDSLDFTTSSAEALKKGTWKEIEGDYKGIMIVVTPCRSDRSTLGLLPYSHLNDGRLHIVLIRSCTVLEYLRFLASIPQTGVESGAFPYVDVIDATAVQITPEGRESVWSADGELLQNSFLSGEVHQGLLQVFARGVA